MNKYLEKIAEARVSREDNTYRALGSLLGGSMVGAAVASPISNHYSKKLMAALHNKGVSDLGTVKKFMRDNKLKTSFNLRPEVVKRKAAFDKKTLESLRHSRIPAYVPFGDTIVGVRHANGKAVNPDIIMHELGHAKDFSKKRGLKIAEAILSRNPLGNLATFGATAATLSDEDTRAYAPAVAAIPGALTMRSEGSANYHAYRSIKDHKGSPAANRFLKTIAKHNTLSYLPMAAAPVLGAYLGGKLLDLTYKSRASSKKK